MREKWKSFLVYVGKNQKKAVVINTVVLTILASVITIKYNIRIDGADKIDSPALLLPFAFKYAPIMLLSAFCGSGPLVVCALVLFIFKTILLSNFSYTSVIYLIMGLSIYFPARMRHMKRLKLVIAAVLFSAVLAGPFWGGALGTMAGFGLTEFAPDKAIYFFINELLECSVIYAVVYLLFRFLPDEILGCFHIGKFYSCKYEMENPDYEDKPLGMSRLGRVITNLIITEAVFLGFMAAIFSNTLVPGLRNSVAEVKNVKSDGDLIPWDEISNTIELEHQISKILRNNNTTSVSTYFGTQNDMMAFDMKLIMLILMLIIPSAILINKYAEWRITRPIGQMANAVKRFNTGNHDDLNEDLRRVKNLNIHTGDEIEDLYTSFSDTFSETVAYIEYIEKQRNLERDLAVAQKANEAKTNFLSNISHEIRTPINAVLGFDEMIIRESKDPSITEHAREIQNSGKTLLSLINDILDFSRIESGRMDIIPVEYDIASMINDLTNMVQVRASEKGIAVNVDVDENIPHVLVGDEMRLRQCTMNILTNAVKYTEKGTIDFCLSFSKINDEFIDLTVKVKDTGQGIKKEDLEKLFAPFERINEKANRTIEGTGLGMNIVKRLLELMGAELSIQSEYGKGSEFAFTLRQQVASWEPVGRFAKQYEESLSRIVMYEESFHAPEARILVVDDTRANLTVIKGLLKENLMQLDMAESGPEAIELSADNKYDIIFLDHRMPGMDGIEAFHHIKEDDISLNKDTPIIVLTANAITGSREKYLSDGFTDYLSKPIDSGRLDSMLLAYLPPDKVYRRGADDFIEQEKNESEEAQSNVNAYQKVVKVTGIDLQKGLDNCGGPELLLEVLKDFYLSIDDKAEKIQQYKDEGDIKNYTIFVHGLKSSARTIGAMKLSDLAAMLERAGNENNAEEIDKWTPVLLEGYRSYKGQIKSAIIENDDVDLPEIPEDELMNALGSIREFVEASYFDSADDIMKMLSGYRIPSEYREKVDKLQKLMSEVDRDGILSLL